MSFPRYFLTLFTFFIQFYIPTYYNIYTKRVEYTLILNYNIRLTYFNRSIFYRIIIK